MTPYYVDFKKRLSITLTILKLVGMWPGTEKFIGSNVYSIFSLGWVLLFNTHVLFRICYWIFVPATFDSAVSSLLLLCLEIFTNVKYYSMLIYYGDVKKLLDHSNDEVYQPKSDKEKMNAISFLQFYKFIYLGYIGTATCAANFICLSPIINKSGQLPVLAWYPWNISNIFFKSVYAHQTINLAYTMLVHVNYDYFAVGLMVFVITQCDILSSSLKNTIVEANKGETILRKHIHHHKLILNHFKVIYKLLNVVMLIQYAATTVTICMTMVQATLIKPTDPVFISMVLYGSACVGELFLYCWFGSEMAYKSEELSKAAFQCNWMEASSQFKKNLEFFIHRTQSPLVICGGDYLIVSLQNFLMILRASYSFFTVMGSMQK